MTNYSSTTYDDLAESLFRALSWLNSIGIAHSRTRFGEYERALSALVETPEKERGVLLRNALPSLGNAIFEAYEIVDIYEALSGLYDHELTRHVRKLAGGPVTYFDERPETSSNLARNIGFELSVMAYLARAGLTLDFSIQTDVAAAFGKRTLLFECKRPQSLDAVEPRITNALRQLRPKFNTIDKARRRGIVALDITKAINPEFRAYVTTTEHGISTSMNEQVDRFLDRHSHCWRNPRSSRAIGVLVRLRQISFVEGSAGSKLYHCQQVAVKPFDNIGKLNVETLRVFTAEISTRQNAASQVAPPK